LFTLCYYGVIPLFILGLDSDIIEVRSFLPSITRIVSKNFEGDEVTEMNSRSIGSSLLGLQRLSSKHAEVRELVTVVKDKIQRSERILDGQAMGNSLFGLQRMTSNHKEVLDLVGVLADKCSMSRYPMDARELSNAFYGLKCLSSSSEEVRRLLVALNGKLAECDENFGSQAIGCLLNGLRGMDSAHDEVKDVLLTVAHKVEKSKRFDKMAVVQACQAFQTFDADHPEVRILLGVLRVKILRSNCELDAEDIRKCVNGLRKMIVRSNIEEAELVDNDKKFVRIKSRHFEVEAFTAALKSLAEQYQQDVDDKLLRYANKSTWHYNPVKHHNLRTTRV
jgi:uncharacterized protein YeeX (DUF496 family)